MAELRRREKEEERVARERVRKQIEADKLARKLKYSTPDSQNAAAVTSPPPAPAPVSSAPAVKKDYTETKIQVFFLIFFSSNFKDFCKKGFY